MVIKPPVKGLTPQEQDTFDHNFKLRTAQRLGVFSRRYQGPGVEAFSRRNYFSGLDAMNEYFDSYQKPSVHLNDGKWQK